ncbi:MAG: hypothetical protein IJJ34_05150 [Clostridia bacterium]|nr:hypothetical protein [Clostridia bacterium]
MIQKHSVSYINMHAILKSCKRNIAFILLAIILCTVAIYAYYSVTHVLKHEYVVEFNYTVLPVNGSTQSGRLSNMDVTASQTLGMLYQNLYSDSVYTDRILERIGINVANNPNNVSIYSYETGSPNVFKMHVSSNSGNLTKMILEAVVDDMQTSPGLPPGSMVVFCEDVHEIDMMETGMGSLKKYVAVGILLGVFLSCVLLALKVVTRCAITEPAVLTALSNLPVLAQKRVPLQRIER